MFFCKFYEMFKNFFLKITSIEVSGKGSWVLYSYEDDSKEYILQEEQKQLPEVFYKKAVLTNFAIFTEKYLCWSLFLVTLQLY